MNLESSVEHARVCVWRVVWQGRGVVALERVRIRPTPSGCATTRMVAPCKEKQRSRWWLCRLTNPACPMWVQRSQAARLPCNRVRSGFTQRVSVVEGANLNVHGASRRKMSGQLRNQGLFHPITVFAAYAVDFDLVADFHEGGNLDRMAGGLDAAGLEYLA